MLACKLIRLPQNILYNVVDHYIFFYKVYNHGSIINYIRALSIFLLRHKERNMNKMLLCNSNDII